MAPAVLGKGLSAEKDPLLAAVSLSHKETEGMETLCPLTLQTPWPVGRVVRTMTTVVVSMFHFSLYLCHHIPCLSVLPCTDWQFHRLVHAQRQRPQLGPLTAMLYAEPLRAFRCWEEKGPVRSTQRFYFLPGSWEFTMQKLSERYLLSP